MPAVLWQLLSDEYIGEGNILSTGDGFFLVYKSLSDILAEKEIHDFLDSQNDRLKCKNFFDDWFLYAVPGENAYSLLKLREQEQDAKDGSPADGDTPGVTVSFISFDCQVLTDCLADPTDANRTKLNREINRVVARRGQRHDDVLKRYFANPASEGAYLAASLFN